MCVCEPFSFFLTREDVYDAERKGGESSINVEEKERGEEGGGQ